MNQLSQLKDLIKENKLDEAKGILTTILDRPLTDEEKGEAIVTLTMLYIEAKNSMDKEFLDVYEKTMKSIKDIDNAQSRLADAKKLEDVRESLK